MNGPDREQCVAEMKEYMDQLEIIDASIAVTRKKEIDMGHRVINSF